MYIKTESIVSCIIAHYLIDAVNLLFLNVVFTNMLLALISLITFIIIFGHILIILLVKFVMDRENKLQDSQIQ